MAKKLIIIGLPVLLAALSCCSPLRITGVTTQSKGDNITLSWSTNELSRGQIITCEGNMCNPDERDILWSFDHQRSIPDYGRIKHVTILSFDTCGNEAMLEIK